MAGASKEKGRSATLMPDSSFLISSHLNLEIVLPKGLKTPKIVLQLPHPRGLHLSFEIATGHDNNAGSHLRFFSLPPPRK